MCRSIKPLFNFDPPATDDEVLAHGAGRTKKEAEQEGARLAWELLQS